MPHSRAVHNRVAKSILGTVYDRDEINRVNAAMDSGAKTHGPKHRDTDPGHALFGGAESAEDLAPRAVHSTLDALDTVDKYVSKVTGKSRNSIYTQR